MKCLHIPLSLLLQDLAPLLGKDALSLWAKALRSSPYMTAPLFSLVEIISQLLQQPDFAPEACQVLEETVSLVPKETLQVRFTCTILLSLEVHAYVDSLTLSTLSIFGSSPQHYGFVVFQAMASVIADSRSPMVLSPLGSLDIILQSMSKAGCAGEIWPEQMQQTGLFAALIGNLLFGDVSHCSDSFCSRLSRSSHRNPDLNSSLPRPCIPQEAVVIQTYFVQVLARLLLGSPPSVFGHLLRSSLPQLAELQSRQSNSSTPFELTPSSIYSKLVSTFVTRFENMSTLRKRKSVGVGLASLLAKADPNFEDEREVYKCLPEMAAIWSGVFAEIKDNDVSG